MKKIVRLFALILMLSMLAGCAAPAAETTAPAAPTTAPVVADTAAPAVVEPTTPPAEVLTPAEQWAKDNGIGEYTPETEDWAAIEAAAKEEGKVVVYSNSSRIANIVDTWNALYPDIVIEVFDLGSDAVVTKVREEQQAGAFTGDIAMGSGSYVAVEFPPLHYLWKYIPPELLDVLPEMNQEPLVTHSLETYGWLYNSKLNDACPITSWWEPTEPEWTGKVAINKDPITSGTDMAMITSIGNHADEFAEMYQARYGKDWTTDEAYGEDTPDAGYLWIKKLAMNKLIAGGDEAWAVMGSPDVTDNILGLFWFSKYRKVIDGEANFEPCVGMEPVVGVQKHNYLSIINQAPHPNAAKLYIRFALSAEGFTPWNQVGQVSGRTDVAPAEEAVPFLELTVWQLDEPFVYENVEVYHDFYSIAVLGQ